MARHKPLPSGVPSDDATRPVVVKWLLENQNSFPGCPGYDEAVAQLREELAQKKPEGWEKQATDACKQLGSAVSRVLKALENTPSQEPCAGSGGEQLPEETGAASGIKAHAPCPKP